MKREQRLITLGRREGLAGSSKVWQVRFRGRVLDVDRKTLRQGLLEGWLSGIESVRREDGDWGPLFGRPVYREVFAGTNEPRDHAKQRARVRVERLRRRAGWALGAAVVCVLASLPVSVVQAPLLLLAGITGVAAGLWRLLGTVHQRELDDLVEQLVPPVMPPPLPPGPPPDWEALAAADEVEALTR